VVSRPYPAKRRRASAPPSGDRILQAADELIKMDAFHTATMDEIARRAGVSRATVFSRFRSKLGVLEALNLRCAGGPEMRAIKSALAIDDPLEALEALIAAVCDLWERQGYLLAQLKAIVVLEPDAGALIDEQFHDQRSDLEGLVRRLRRAGKLRPGLGEDPATATLYMLTSVETFLALRRDGDLSLRQTRHTITQLTHTLLI
jgi:AcrR family transcriptional regulator